MRRSVAALAGLGLVVGAGFFGWRWAVVRAPGAATPAASCAAPTSSSAGDDPAQSAADNRSDGGKATDRMAGRSLQLPTGAPAGLSCRDARRVVEQARLHLAAEPEAVDARALAEATVDWLDPHGLWSAPPDAPLAAFLRKRERELVRELESPVNRGSCPVADEAGALMATWIASLTRAFDEAERHATPVSAIEAFRVVSEPIFEDRAVARPARDLVRELGHRVGLATRSFGEPMGPYVRAARERFIPGLSAGAWSRAVLAAALRAYLPQIDPHGGWAPLDEETSLYEVDLEAVPPPRLWDHMVRSSLGVRVDTGVAP